MWLDGKTLLRQFGEERTEHFQPYRKLIDSRIVFGGGSDHMQKIGSMRSVNPYNPFLGMWITLSRIPRGMDTPLHPEHLITREETIRFYTINNAFLTFEEEEKGSLEPNKLADFIVLDKIRESKELLEKWDRRPACHFLPRSTGWKPIPH